MKLKTMTAAFGKLTGQTLELAPGFNLIEAPNEGGKSTWAAFLKAMLYGVDTRGRDKKGQLADKNRYQPWSGVPMEGEITLEWRGRNLTLRRGPRGNIPFGAFSAVYTGTEEPIPGLTAELCGEVLLGVGRDLYERSAFLGQSASLAIQSVPELERRIAALVTGGEEDVSYSQAEDRLNEWRNRRKVNKSVGRIPQLEEELRQVRQQREELEQLNGAGNALAAEERRLRLEKLALEREMALHKALAQQDLNRRFTQAKAALDQAQAALDALRREQSRFGHIPDREALKRAQGELAFLKALDPEIKQGEIAAAQAEAAASRARSAAQDPRFSGLTGAEAVQEAAASAAEIAQNQEASRSARTTGRMLLALAVFSGAALGASNLLLPQWPGPPALLWGGLALAAVVLGAGIAMLVKGRRLNEQANQVLDRYQVDSAEELTGFAADYQRRAAEADQAGQQAQLVQAGVQERRDRRENSRRDLFAFVHAFAPEVTDLFGCSAALSRALGLDERESVAQAKLEGAQELYSALLAQGGQLEDPEAPALTPPERSMEQTAARLGEVQAEWERTSRALNMTLGRQKAAGDPASLAARQETLERELERRNQEYQALTAALEALSEANAQLQERFSPELNRRAGAYLARLTGEKYTSLSLNRELEAAAAGRGDVLPRRSLFLSKGTVDQIYLAVRLAVYDLCLQEERAPLVLDDALAAFDDARMGRALDLLLELSQETQILFFTCQNREGEYLAHRTGVHSIALP